MRNCILGNMYYVPVERVPNHALVLVDMKATPIWFDRKQARPKPIYQTFLTEDDYMAFPVAYGLEHYPDPHMDIQLSRGGELIAPKRPDPNHPKAPAGQGEFMQELIDYFEENYIGLAVAKTGTGKTVVSLNMAAERGRSTLVVTDREFLGFEQWIPEAKDKLGLSDDQIGIIQGQECQYNKPFVVAMAKSLMNNEYDPECYEAFGTVIFDELHKFGARRMSSIMGQFYAECRLGMTATPKRPDGTAKLFLNMFGEPAIIGRSEALPTQVKVVDYQDHEPGRFPSSHGPRMQRLARDAERNKILVREIMKMYNEGRNILVIGDDIKHLQRLELACWKHGVPENHTGQFSRQRYIMVSEADVHHRTGETIILKRQKKAMITNEYLNWCKNHARIIFSTYGMIKEGIDIPRLDGGIDATPRREAEQTIGRIRRPLEGKLLPLWVTIRDTSHDALLGYFEERLKDYIKCNVEVINYDQ